MESWGNYRRLVMDSLERLERQHEAHSRALAGIRQEIAGLKVRSGVWGAVAGGIPVLIALIILYLERK